ncbi:uncharacterized protein JN550_001175 [Neoarthrinium moseri]|uniref:uncharacterized protein n=1 Tax=Neoarthrinium moseri TaxID=1658444 RepID=UPI001FDC59B2|nr:uncharacterized protein JN550_001175 [Neoarthrinium moseri]KAI1877103.1 hypothetical protein JN550_001175 [Neoarthrinium moseri]
MTRNRSRRTKKKAAEARVEVEESESAFSQLGNAGESSNNQTPANIHNQAPASTVTESKPPVEDAVKPGIERRSSYASVVAGNHKPLASQASQPQPVVKIANDNTERQDKTRKTVGPAKSGDSEHAIPLSFAQALTNSRSKNTRQGSSSRNPSTHDDYQPPSTQQSQEVEGAFVGNGTGSVSSSKASESKSHADNEMRPHDRKTRQRSGSYASVVASTSAPSPAPSPSDPTRNKEVRRGSSDTVNSTGSTAPASPSPNTVKTKSTEQVSKSKSYTPHKGRENESKSKTGDSGTFFKSTKLNIPSGDQHGTQSESSPTASPGIGPNSTKKKRKRGKRGHGRRHSQSTDLGKQAPEHAEYEEKSNSHAPQPTEGYLASPRSVVPGDATKVKPESEDKSTRDLETRQADQVESSLGLETGENTGRGSEVKSNDSAIETSQVPRPGFVDTGASISAAVPESSSAYSPTAEVFHPRKKSHPYSPTAEVFQPRKNSRPYSPTAEVFQPHTHRTGQHKTSNDKSSAWRTDPSPGPGPSPVSGYDSSSPVKTPVSPYDRIPTTPAPFSPYHTPFHTQGFVGGFPPGDRMYQENHGYSPNTYTQHPLDPQVETPIRPPPDSTTPVEAPQGIQELPRKPAGLASFPLPPKNEDRHARMYPDTTQRQVPREVLREDGFAPYSAGSPGQETNIESVSPEPAFRRHESPDLPWGWMQREFGPSRELVYINFLTQETQMERPTEPASVEPSLYSEAGHGTSTAAADISTPVNSAVVEPPVWNYHTLQKLEQQTRPSNNIIEDLTRAHHSPAARNTRNSARRTNFVPSPLVTFAVEGVDNQICQLCDHSTLELATPWPVIKDTQPAILPCGHCFGAECLLLWLREYDICPEPSCQMSVRHRGCGHKLDPLILDTQRIFSVPKTIIQGGQVGNECRRCRIRGEQEKEAKQFHQLQAKFREARATVSANHTEESEKAMRVIYEELDALPFEVRKSKLSTLFTVW